MSERYTRLFSLPGNLYAEGAPVIVEAGALLKDNAADRVIVQLKFWNISDKAIRALTVAVTAMDTAGRKLGGETAFDYLDLDERRDSEFGSQVPLIMEDKATRSFAVRVVEVIFADRSIWTEDGAPWESIPGTKTIEMELNNSQLVKQFRIKYGEKCIQMYRSHKDLWICACGAVNRDGEERCHRCRLVRESISSVDLDVLRDEMSARLEKEAAERRAQAQAAAEERARLEAEREEKKAKVAAFAKKYWKHALAAVIALILLATVPKQISKMRAEAKRRNAYNAAVELLNNGQYDEAIDAFYDLGEYRDSKEQIEHAEELREEAKKKADYDQAKRLFEAGDYDGAIDAFEELGDYRDSEAQIEKVREQIKQDAYDAAAALLQEGKYDEANKAFRELGNYKDSKAQALNAVEAKKEAEKKEHYENAAAALKAEEYDTAIREFTKAGDYLDSKEMAEKARELKQEAEEKERKEKAEAEEKERLLKEEEERKKAYKEVVDLVVKKGTDFKYGDFEGKGLLLDPKFHKIADYKVHVAAREANPDELYVFAVYDGENKKSVKEKLHFRLSLNGVLCKYNMKAAYICKDKSLEFIEENGGFDLDRYQYGNTLECTEIKAEAIEKKEPGFTKSKEAKTLPTEGVSTLLTVLERFLVLEKLDVTMQNLGFSAIS